VTVALTEHDDGSRVQVRVGDTVEVRLPEIASSGYRWSAEALDPSMFELNETGADYPSEALGSSGYALFRIAVRAAGNGTLRLKYWRPWEGEAGVQRRFTVDVEAAPRRPRRFRAGGHSGGQIG
jgi:inhibitor of cysteine peptidase